jgi:hypothetical protein
MERNNKNGDAKSIENPVSALPQLLELVHTAPKPPGFVQKLEMHG